jgi:uncharacterized protein
MYYGVARLEFLLPQSRSLKEKRSVMNRIKDRLAGRFAVAVAEVDYQDLWQRGAIGVALVSLGVATARDGLAAVRREAESDPRIEILDFSTHVARFGDQEFAGGEDE